MITVFLPEGVLKDLDDLTALNIIPNRSEGIRQAIDQYLNCSRIQSKLVDAKKIIGIKEMPEHSGPVSSCLPDQEPAKFTGDPFNDLTRDVKNYEKQDE